MKSLKTTIFFALFFSLLTTATPAQAGLMPYRFDISVLGTSDNTDDLKAVELMASGSLWVFGTAVSLGHGYFTPGQEWGTHFTWQLHASYPFPVKGMVHIEPKIGLGTMISSLQVTNEAGPFMTAFLKVGVDFGFPVTSTHHSGYLQTYSTRQLFFSVNYRLLMHFNENLGNHVLMVGLGYKFSAF